MPLLSVLDLYGHNGMVSLSVKLLDLNWIGPFAALQFFFFFLNQCLLVKLFFMSQLPVMSHPLPSVLLVCVFLRHSQGFLLLSPSVWLSECVSPGTGTSFCTCKGCVFALGQGQ